MSKVEKQKHARVINGLSKPYNSTLINMLKSVKGGPTPEESQGTTAVSLLINLETAQQGRSVLLSDEQRLLFKGRKKGVCLEYQMDFMSIKTDSCKA
jgi:hypothetical protein